MNDVKYNQQLDAEINWFFKINYLKKKTEYFMKSSMIEKS